MQPVREPPAPRPVAPAGQPVRVYLLGGFRVSVGTRAVADGDWRLRKTRSLLKLLALAPGHRLHREHVCDTLWPDLGADAASNNLHYALHVARRALDPDPAAVSYYLRTQSDHVALCPEGDLWVDVEAFEAAIAAARGTRDPEKLRDALDLYAGELLPEDLYEEWAALRRERLRDKYISLLNALARLHEESGSTGEAIQVFERAVREEPAYEEAHRGLMRLYARIGQRHQALRQYEHLRQALRRELDAEPEDETMRLHAEILAGRHPVTGVQITSPSAQATADRAHNLPTPLTSFVGREREMEEVRHLIKGTRHLTLTGTGGCGKTRLAVEVASSLLEAFPGGVRLVELASRSDPSLVPRVVAEALGVRKESGRPLLETLAVAVGEKRLLLILDNCEHLLDACAELAEVMLAACPHLRILATSREILGARGEVAWRVPSLELPESRASSAPDELLGYGAVRLFVDRARSRSPGFELTAGNALAVKDICARLDGIPLALELAAARVGSLGVEQIANRLAGAPSTSLQLLSAGGRTVTPRHRTLRGAIDWSYQQLDQHERLLLDRLSVFVGGELRRGCPGAAV